MIPEVGVVGAVEVMIPAVGVVGVVDDDGETIIPAVTVAVVGSVVVITWGGAVGKTADVAAQLLSPPKLFFLLSRRSLAHCSER